MAQIEIIEVINPPEGAIIREMTCYVCNKRHLQKGKIARVWVLFQEGYMTNASLECVECQHESGTVYQWHTYLATLEEPGETVGRLYCDTCGEQFELGYEPEGMELRCIEDAEYLEDQ